MATPISRDILNRETNARYWTRTKYKIGERLDPADPRDQAQMPIWMSIFRQVQAEARAGNLVTTYDDPEVIQALADARLASTMADAHQQAAVNAPDPAAAQDHAATAAAAREVADIRATAAAARQPTPPPTAEGGMLRPEDDPWDSRYVPREEAPVLGPPAAPVLGPSAPPRPAPARRPSRSPRERVSRGDRIRETNFRFWNRTGYKPHQRLDMSIPEDRRQAETWREIFREVEREANQGRLTFTDPELVPPAEPEDAAPPTDPAPSIPSGPTPTPEQAPGAAPSGLPFPLPWSLRLPEEPQEATPTPVELAPGTAPPSLPIPEEPQQTRPLGAPSAPGTAPGLPFPLPWPLRIPEGPRETRIPGTPSDRPLLRPTPRPSELPRRPSSPPARGPDVRRPGPARETPILTSAPSVERPRPRPPAPTPTSPTQAPMLTPTSTPTPTRMPSTFPGPTTEGAPDEGMGTLGLLAIGVFGVTAVLSLVYAATRRPSERSGARVRSAARPFPTFTATRSWR